MLNKEVLVLFSGGKDSFLATLLMLEKGYNVSLVTYENGCVLKGENALETANRIKGKYGSMRVNILNTKRTEAIFREFIYSFYNKKPSEILKEYGEVPISQFNCLACRLSMYVYSIILAKKMNINIVVDGARKSQLFAIEQAKLLRRFEIFFNKFNLEIKFPLKDFEDDFELKNELLIRGFVPKTIEPQCLLGIPVSNNGIDDESVEATARVFDKLLLEKAERLIDRYKNIEISGEYV